MKAQGLCDESHGTPRLPCDASQEAHGAVLMLGAEDLIPLMSFALVQAIK